MNSTCPPLAFSRNVVTPTTSSTSVGSKCSFFKPAASAIMEHTYTLAPICFACLSMSFQLGALILAMPSLSLGTMGSNSLGHISGAGFDDASVIGDASAVPVAKTGVTAHLQAEVVAKRLQGEDARNSGRTNCPFDLGYGLGTFVISDYRNPVVKLPPSRFSHMAKMLFAATYWDMVRYPELWNPIFEAYFDATEPAKLARIYV